MNDLKGCAEIEYQLGAIAEDDIQYRKALSHFERAAQLSPDDEKYKNRAEKIRIELEKNPETKEHPVYCCCSKCVPNHWADAPNRGEEK